MDRRFEPLNLTFRRCHRGLHLPPCCLFSNNEQKLFYLYGAGARFTLYRDDCNVTSRRCHARLFRHETHVSDGLEATLNCWSLIIHVNVSQTDHSVICPHNPALKHCSIQILLEESSGGSCVSHRVWNTWYRWQTTLCTVLVHTWRWSHWPAVRWPQQDVYIDKISLHRPSQCHLHVIWVDAKLSYKEAEGKSNTNKLKVNSSLSFLTPMLITTLQELAVNTGWSADTKAKERLSSERNEPPRWFFRSNRSIWPEDVDFHTVKRGARTSRLRPNTLCGARGARWLTRRLMGRDVEQGAVNTYFRALLVWHRGPTPLTFAPVQITGTSRPMRPARRPVRMVKNEVRICEYLTNFQYRSIFGKSN